MHRAIRTLLCCLLAIPLVALTGAPAAAQPTPDSALRADYQLQETLDSWAGTARPLTNLGLGNAFVQQEIDGAPRTVLAFPEGSGLQLAPVAGVIPAETYSIAVFFRFDSVDGYRRIIDVKNRTSDTGLYVLNGSLEFYSGDVSRSAVVFENTWTQVVLTRDAAGTVTVYVDAIREIQFDDVDGRGVIESALRFFQDDNQVSGEESAGVVARIRLYDRALTQTEVSLLDH